MNGRQVYRIICSKNRERINDLFEQIYNEHFRLLYFVAYSYINNEQIVEDLVQNAFVDFFNRCLEGNQIKDIKNVKSYLCSIVKHESLKEKKRLFLNDSSFDIDSIPNNEKQKISEIYLNELLKILNKDELGILVDHVFLDQTFKEISQERGVPLNTIKSKYRRAIVKFREAIKDEK